MKAEGKQIIVITKNDQRRIKVIVSATCHEVEIPVTFHTGSFESDSQFNSHHTALSQSISLPLPPSLSHRSSSLPLSWTKQTSNLCFPSSNQPLIWLSIHLPLLSSLIFKVFDWVVLRVYIILSQWSSRVEVVRCYKNVKSVKIPVWTHFRYLKGDWADQQTSFDMVLYLAIPALSSHIMAGLPLSPLSSHSSWQHGKLALSFQLRRKQVRSRKRRIKSIKWVRDRELIKSYDNN